MARRVKNIDVGCEWEELQASLPRALRQEGNRPRHGQASPTIVSRLECLGARLSHALISLTV